MFMGLLGAMNMGLLKAGHVVLRYALRILGVLRLSACVVCSRDPIWVEG
jgi:hypothetical protein